MLALVSDSTDMEDNSPSGDTSEDESDKFRTEALPEALSGTVAAFIHTKDGKREGKSGKTEQIEK